MTKEEILNGMSEEEFYSLYPTRESWEQAQQQMAYGGIPDIMGVPFGAGITMANGGTYYGGPIYPAQNGAIIPANFEPAPSTAPGIIWNPETGETLKDPINQPVSRFQAYGKQGQMDNTPTQGTVGITTNLVDTNKGARKAFPKIGQPAGTIWDANLNKFVKVKKFGGGLPGGPNEFDIPCYTCGGMHMAEGGDVRDKPGGSNVGKKTFADGSPRTGPYVGPSGGAPAGSYPVPDIKHARAALSLAHNAPNPSGIKEAVYKKYPSLRKQEGGSMTPDLEGLYPTFGYGGYDYGGPSPFNYGQFPAMQGGGDPTAAWLAGEQMALQKKTKTGIQTGVKPTGTNPLNFNPFLKGSDIAQPDSMHTSPYNPNIAAYFKGNKVIAGPATDSGQARKEALMLNRGKMFRKDDEIYPNYIGNYKARGGDLTSQGGNQDFLNNRNSAYMTYIQNNVLNNMHEEESQKVQDAFMQMEYGAAPPMADASMMYNDMMQYGAQFNPENAALIDAYSQRINQHNDRRRQDFQTFADMTTDFVDQITAQQGRIVMPNWEYSNYIPQNDIRTGYTLGKSDFAKLAKLQGQGKITGAKLNYGTLGRFMPRVFGPKSIEVGYINPNKGMFEDLKEPISFDNTETQSGKSYDDMNRFQKWRDDRRVSKMIKKEEQHRADLANFKPQDEALNDMNWFERRAAKKAVKALNNQDSPEELANRFDNAERKFFWNNTPAPSKAYGGLFQAQPGASTPVSYDKWEESLRFKAPLIDDSEEMPPMIPNTAAAENKPLDLSDVAGIQKRRKELEELTGKPMNDQPDLFASDSATFNKKTRGVGRFLGKNAPLIADTISSMFESKENRKNEQKMKNLMLADNAFLTTPMNGMNRGDYDINSGMFRPDDMVPVQFPGYAQWGGFNTMAFGGDVSEGEELDLSPEEIDELRQQGYEIEYLD